MQGPLTEGRGGGCCRVGADVQSSTPRFDQHTCNQVCQQYSEFKKGSEVLSHACPLGNSSRGSETPKTRLLKKPGRKQNGEKGRRRGANAVLRKGQMVQETHVTLEMG